MLKQNYWYPALAALTARDGSPSEGLTTGSYNQPTSSAKLTVVVLTLWRSEDGGEEKRRGEVGWKRSKTPASRDGRPKVQKKPVTANRPTWAAKPRGRNSHFVTEWLRMVVRRAEERGGIRH